MPKAILEFNLPDDQDDHLRALHGSEAFTTLWNVDNECRHLLKYTENPSEDCKKLATKIREMCWEALEKIE